MHHFEKLYLNFEIFILNIRLLLKNRAFDTFSTVFAVLFAFVIFFSPVIFKVNASSNLSGFTFSYFNPHDQSDSLWRAIEKSSNLKTYDWVASEGGACGTGTLAQFCIGITSQVMGKKLCTTDDKCLVVSGAGTAVSSTVGAMYQSKPYDTGTYIAKIQEKLNPIKSVEAQTSTVVPSGRVILSVIASIHSAIMNMIFILYIFVFIIIAFAIMMRQKLSGSTYVTVMNTIPRIIISLILVAFSYPIAAAVIDIGYLSMNILYDAAVNTVTWNIDGNATSTVANYTGDKFGPDKAEFVKSIAPNSRSMNVFQLFGVATLADSGFVPGSDGAIDLANINLGNSGLGTLVSNLGNMFSNFVEGAANSRDSTAVGWIVIWIISIAALFAIFKLFFALLKEFLNILFYPLAAPIMFAMYALPGNDKMISNWFKNYAGSVFSFVAVYGLFLIITMLGHGVVLNEGNSWNPFLLGFVNAPSVGALSSLIGYGLFIISPQIPEMVKKAIGSSGGGMDKYVDSIKKETQAAAKRGSFGAIG